MTEETTEKSYVTMSHLKIWDLLHVHRRGGEGGLAPPFLEVNDVNTILVKRMALHHSPRDFIPNADVIDSLLHHYEPDLFRAKR